MAVAIQWVARIFAIALLMFLPGVGGKWLDDRLDTNIFALVGFGLGLGMGLAVLLVMVGQNPPPGSSGTNAGSDNTQLKAESEDLKDYGSGEH